MTMIERESKSRLFSVDLDPKVQVTLFAYSQTSQILFNARHCTFKHKIELFKITEYFLNSKVMIFLCK
jgi:hypothetical protein